jgi:2,5-furandicarboxylate decarboxylase 1
MNVVEKPGTHLKSNVADFERFRLRRFIEALDQDQLDTRGEGVDLAGLAEVLEGNQKAVLFRSA